jgi:lysophospholipase L1-like esterase
MHKQARTNAGRMSPPAQSERKGLNMPSTRLLASVVVIASIVAVCTVGNWAGLPAAQGAAATSAPAANAAPAKPIQLKKDDVIVFLGDSITAGATGKEGFITLVDGAIQAKSKDLGVKCIGAGISGNKVPDLQNRLDKDVIAKKPTIVFVYIGINDVWHGANGTPKDKYEAGLKDVVARIQKAGATVVVCTPSVIGEKKDGGNPNDAKLDDYAQISRDVAKATGARVVDLRKEFVKYDQDNNPKNDDRGILTADQVHLNAAGNKLVAKAMAEALGLKPE